MLPTVFLESEVALPFPTLVVKHAFVLLQLRFPLIFAGILTYDSLKSTPTIIRALIGFQ
jgi:hypothetical protein